MFTAVRTSRHPRTACVLPRRLSSGSLYSLYLPVSVSAPLVHFVQRFLSTVDHAHVLCEPPTSQLLSACPWVPGHRPRWAPQELDKNSRDVNVATLGLPLPGLPPLSDIPLPFLATPSGHSSQPACCTHPSAVAVRHGVRNPQRKSQTHTPRVHVILLVQGSRPLQCLPALGHRPEPSTVCARSCVCNCCQQEGQRSMHQKLRGRRQTFKDNFSAL